ncbi:amidohydrolase family protein [Streptomyces sp. NPDC013178]|uniref:metal-dependent hydrolase family protein n=1 Tax=Streptomyces sp. NPDC013178 TaxID=3155118 RepID=UPI0033E2E66A
MKAVRGARLFDGERLVDDATVLVRDGRIVMIGSDDLPDVAEVTDLGDVTLLPGLVDSHVHLAFDCSDPAKSFQGVDDEQILARMRSAARTTLAMGVTTVRDLGDRGYLSLQLRKELAADPSAGPHLLVAGPPITTTGGHCWYLGGEADGVDGVRAAVRERAEHGVDLVKVMAGGGAMTPGSAPHLSQYGIEELRAAAEEAHAHGLPITAHAHGVQSVSDAVAAGFDSVEHCWFVGERGVEDRPDVIEALASSGVTVSMTIALKAGGELPPPLARLLSAVYEHVRKMRAAGVTIVGSSDSGVGGQLPHNALPYTVQALVEAGWSTAEALHSVTALAAELCRVGDRKGRLAPGKDADLLAVAGNPLDDPAALLDVRAVYREGHRVR